MTSKMLPCAGFIILTKDLKHVVLVQNHNGVYSFPKGNCKSNETMSETAYRELHEEAGIIPSAIEVLDNKFIDELSNKGNLAIRLFIGFLIDEKFKLQPQDTDEIATVKLVDVETAKSVLIQKRKDVLENALEIVKTSTLLNPQKDISIERILNRYYAEGKQNGSDISDLKEYDYMIKIGDFTHTLLFEYAHDLDSPNIIENINRLDLISMIPKNRIPSEVKDMQIKEVDISDMYSKVMLIGKNEKYHSEYYKYIYEENFYSATPEEYANFIKLCESYLTNKDLCALLITAQKIDCI